MGGEGESLCSASGGCRVVFPAPASPLMDFADAPLSNASPSPSCCPAPAPPSCMLPTPSPGIVVVVALISLRAKSPIVFPTRFLTMTFVVRLVEHKCPLFPLKELSDEW